MGHRFVVALNIPYERLRDCSIDKFGVSRCFVVQTKQHEVCSFQYVDHNGLVINTERTIAAYEFIHGKILK